MIDFADNPTPVTTSGWGEPPVMQKAVNRLIPLVLARRKFVTWTLVLLAFSLASGPQVQAVSVQRLELRTGGPDVPPGDRIDLDVWLHSGEWLSHIEVRAYAISGDNNEVATAVAARRPGNGDTAGRFLLVSRIDAQTSQEMNLVSTTVVVPYDDLALDLGTHQLGYIVAGFAGDNPVFTVPSRLSRVIINDDVIPPKGEVKSIKFAVPLKAMTNGGDQLIEHLEPPALRANYSLDRERETYRSQPWKPEQKKLIFYATNRGVDDPDGTARRFGGQLSESTRYGRALVNIPVQVHTEPGVLELRNWWQKPDSNKFFEIDALNEVAEEVFARSISGALRDDGKDILLYVHGYNNTFEFAALRMAQFVHDIKFTGTPLLFSWPSQGDEKGYRTDERLAASSVGSLAGVLKLLIGNRQMEPTRAGGKIHLVAHSMGSRVLLNAIQKVILDAEEPGNVFGQVILAAPDLDVQDFLMLAAQTFKSAETVTLYFCEQDKALLASQAVHLNKRVGQAHCCLEPLVNIGASAVNTSWLGHDYFASTSPLLVDFHLSLVRRIPPGLRQTIRHVPLPGNCGFFEFR